MTAPSQSQSQSQSQSDLFILTSAEPILAAVNNASIAVPATSASAANRNGNGNRRSGSFHPDANDPPGQQLLLPGQQRSSNVSNSTDNDDSATPATLDGDLEHYKELFSKLRITYLEQSSKEGFLRSLFSSPPLIVSGPENVALERQLGERKTELRTRKEEARLMVEAMGRRARELAARSVEVERMNGIAGTLPAEIEALDTQVRELRRAAEGREEGMGLTEMRRMIGKRDGDVEDVKGEIRGLEREIRGSGREADRLEEEVRDLQERRQSVVAEVQEMKASGRVLDRDGMGLEERWRWEKSREGVLRELLGLKAEA